MAPTRSRLRPRATRHTAANQSMSRRKVSDCGDVQGEKRIECGACVAQNEAKGWLGTFEYRPDEKEGKRCVRVK